MKTLKPLSNAKDATRLAYPHLCNKRIFAIQRKFQGFQGSNCLVLSNSFRRSGNFSSVLTKILFQQLFLSEDRSQFCPVKHQIYIRSLHFVSLKRNRYAFCARTKVFAKLKRLFQRQYPTSLSVFFKPAIFNIKTSFVKPLRAS